MFESALKSQNIDMMQLLLTDNWVVAANVFLLFNDGFKNIIDALFVAAQPHLTLAHSYS